MILYLNKTKRSSKILITKFLFLPLLYRGTLYWLEKVRIKKCHNGFKYEIVNVEKHIK